VIYADLPQHFYYYLRIQASTVVVDAVYITVQTSGCNSKVRTNDLPGDRARIDSYSILTEGLAYGLNVSV